MAARPLHPASWTLRTRLLAALMSLLAAVSLVIGLVSVVALDRFLLDRLDDQLDAAVGRSENAFDEPDQGDSQPDLTGTLEPGFLLVPGQAEGTLGAVLSNGRVIRSATLNRSGDPESLDAVGQRALLSLSADARPHTVDLGAALGDYRLLAVSTSPGEVIVTGLPLREITATIYQLTGIITAVAVAGLLTSAGAGAVIIRLTLRPLHRVAATASRVTELPLDRGEVALAERVPPQDTNSRTEVGQVGAALNLMLGHIAAALTARQHSETRVRQFVADASHELRTPLTAIRGYAELTRRSPAVVPPDIAHALHRVESEAVRMTGLVDDLLLLARLDAGRPVQCSEQDLSRLLMDATSDARAAGPDHHWQLHLPGEPVTVHGDPVTLHQMVANLLTNARTHTPPGTPVSIALERRADDAVLTVTDNGPGIPAALLPDVFARFSRGDSSRSRVAGSTGLGLAIVAAVVEAHHGRVSVVSRPARTSFTVTLPIDRTS